MQLQNCQYCVSGPYFYSGNLQSRRFSLKKNHVTIALHYNKFLSLFIPKCSFPVNNKKIDTDHVPFLTVDSIIVNYKPTGLEDLYRGGASFFIIQLLENSSLCWTNIDTTFVGIESSPEMM